LPIVDAQVQGAHSLITVTYPINVTAVVDGEIRWSAGWRALPPAEAGKVFGRAI
jgi:hypothetical protein